MNILPLEQIQRIAELPENEFLVLKDQWQLITAGGEKEAVVIDKQNITNCVVLAGTPISDSATASSVYPTLLWCPGLLRPDDGFVLLYQQRIYTAIVDYVRDTLAARIAD